VDAYHVCCGMCFGGVYVLVISKMSFGRAEDLYLCQGQVPEGQRGQRGPGGKEDSPGCDSATISSTNVLMQVLTEEFSQDCRPVVLPTLCSDSHVVANCVYVQVQSSGFSDVSL
jgi:hypothetical protein